MTPEDLTAARQYARAYARWRCGGKLPLYPHCPPNQTGRGKLDPVYVEETEHRDQKAFWDHYSSCGDLSQGLAWHLGVRKPYVNRKTMPGGWIPGRNLLHFYDGRQGAGVAGGPNIYPTLNAYVKANGPPAIRVPQGYEPQAGDLGFIWTPGLNNAHTFVWGRKLDAEHFETFNYGAGGMTRAEFPGAHCSETRVEHRATGGTWGLWLGGRKLMFIVPLERLLADSDDLPAMSGEVIDELERRVP